MKLLGYALISLGFLGGAFTAVRQVEGVNVAVFIAWLVAGVLGVIVVRRAGHAEATDTIRLNTNIEAIEGGLRKIVEEADKLNEEKEAINVYDLRHVIDQRFPAELTRFVDARESIAHSYGLQAYAEVMNRFAAGERYLNRVWSASTDGYVDEASRYIELSAEQFHEALDKFTEIRSAGRGFGGRRRAQPRATT
jgi:hypothetical protein